MSGFQIAYVEYSIIIMPLSFRKADFHVMNVVHRPGLSERSEKLSS